VRMMMLEITNFQSELWGDLAALLNVSDHAKKVVFKDKTIGLNYQYRDFDFWIYDDEASFTHMTDKYVFERPDYVNLSDLKNDFLRKVRELI
jgi:hypothetical protein